MASRDPIQAAIIKEYLGKMQGEPLRAVARRLRADHPLIFKSVDLARSGVSYYAGRHGKRHRAELADRRFQLPEPTADNPLSMPISKSADWLPYTLPDSAQSILVIGDVHVPYHDLKSLTLAIQYGKKNDVDTVVLNGDFADCYALSRFERNPERRLFQAEREAIVQALYAIRNAYQDARIIYKEGNHEARFGALLETRAPELFGMSEFRLDVIFDLYNLGIEWVAEKRPIRYRELDILHGHELPAKTGGVNPARTALLKCRSCCLVSHYHRKTNDVQVTLRGDYLQAWSIGCLSELHPQYMPINDWMHGFAWIRGGDDWQVFNHGVINGRVV